MGSIVRLSGIMTAVALAGAALTAAPAAQAMTSGLAPTWVPCSTSALVAAINTANTHGRGTFILSGNCTYNITTPATATDGLPVITGSINLVSMGRTVISRDPAAPTAFRILDVATGGTLGLRGISIRNGTTSGLGGGIQNAGTLRLNRVNLSGNKAGNGGALANLTGATASVFYTHIGQNTTTGVGGGGIINSGNLTLVESTLSDNSAPINGGGLNTQASGTSRIALSTFVGNVSGSHGGGISNLGTTSLNFTLVKLNKGSSGGGIATSNNNVTLRHSIVSRNTPNNCSPLHTVRGCVH
jgi:hypothetical protein